MAVFIFLILTTAGCASFAYRVIKSPSVSANGAVSYLQDVPAVSQEAYQCGPAALESVMRHWGRQASTASISESIYKTGSRGVLNFSLAQVARDQGFWTQTPQTNTEGLKNWVRKGVPPIVMISTGVLWVPNYHFIVLKGFDDNDRVFYANIGKPDTYFLPYSGFESRWTGAGNWCLVLCPPDRVDWELDAAQAAELGLLLDRSGRPDLAIRRYSEALDQNPENTAVRFNLANVYLKTKKKEESKKIYQELIRQKPGFGPAANNLAWIYLEENRYEDAILTVESAFKNGAARTFDILDTLGLAYCRAGDRDSARTHLLEAINMAAGQDTEALPLIKKHLDECR